MADNIPTPSQYMEETGVKLPPSPEEFLKKKDESVLDGPSTSETPSGFRTVIEKGEERKVPLVPYEEIGPETFVIDEKQAVEEAKQARLQREGAAKAITEQVSQQLPGLKNFIDTELEKISTDDAYYTGKQPSDVEGEQFYLTEPGDFYRRTKQVENYRTTKRLVSDLEKLAETPTDAGLKSFWKGLSSKNAVDLLSLGYFEMFDELKVANVAEKSREGRELTEDEQALLTVKYLVQELKANKDLPSTYNIGMGLAEMVPYISQIALTSPIAGGVSGAAKATAKGNIKRIITKYGLADLAGVAAAAPFTGIMWESVGEKKTGQLGVDEKGDIRAIKGTEESDREAIAKAYTNTVVELFTEKLGGKIFKGSGKSAAKGMKGVDPATKVKKLGDQFRKTAQWDGLMAEFTEEQLATIGQAVTTGDASIKDLFDAEKQLEMLGTLAIAGGVFKMTELPSNIRRKSIDNAFSNARNGLNIIEDESIRNQVIEDIDSSRSIEDMKSKMQDRGYEMLSADQQGAIVDYMTAKISKDAADGYQEEIEIQEEIDKAKEEVVVEKEKKPVEKKEPVKAEEKKKEEKVEEEVAEAKKEAAAEEIISEVKEELKVEELPDNVIKTKEGLFELNEEQTEQRKEMIDKYGKERADELIKEFVDINDLRKYEVPPEEFIKKQKEARKVVKEVKKEEVVSEEIEKLKIKEDAKRSRIAAEKAGERVSQAREIEEEERRELREREEQVRPRVEGDARLQEEKEGLKVGQEVAFKDFGDDVIGEVVEIGKDFVSVKTPDGIVNKIGPKYTKATDLVSDKKNVSEIKASIFEENLKRDIGKKRVADLKEKKAEKLQSINDRIARLSGAKFVEGEELKPDVVNEVVGLIQDLIEVGAIDLELGGRAAIDKAKKYVKNNPALIKAIDDNSDAIEAQLTKDTGVGKEPPKKPPKAKKQVKEEEAPKKRTSQEVIQESIEAEEAALKSIKKGRGKERVKWFRKLFVDRPENFRTALIKEDKELGQRASDYFNLQAGVSGKSLKEFHKGRQKILGKFGHILSEGEQQALEQYIKMKRISELEDVFKKRGEEFLQPEDTTKAEAESIVKAIENNDKEMLERFGLDSFDKIKERANAYWDTMRGILKDYLDNGIINQAAYDKLIEEQPFYSRREYLQHFEDKIDKGGLISGIDELSGGSTGAVLTDIQTLLADAISRKNAVIARAKTLRVLDDYAAENPDNGIVKTASYSEDFLKKLADKEERDPFVAPEFEPAPRGYESFDYMEDGMKKRLYVSSEYVDEFKNEMDPEWLTKLMNGISWISGNKILKAFATGYNPEFMVKNIPLDMTHIMTTTEEYSNWYPKATAQMLSDMKTVMPDLLKRKGRYLDYINEGGGMDFLTTQGSLTPKKFKNYNKWTTGTKAIADAAAYLGNTSEMLTRLSLRERSINNRVEKFKEENGRDPNKEEMKEIQERSTAVARNYLDFSQGGRAVKLMNSAIPYLNAGFQVTRGTLRAAARNPRVFWGKMAQLGGTATAITAWNLGLYQDLWSELAGEDDEEKEERMQKAEEMKHYFLNDISDRTKADNFVMMTPISYFDKNDNKRYVYFKFPKDNSQRIITGLFEGSLMEAAGVEKGLLSKQRFMEVESLVQNSLDLGNLPPLFRATLGYQLNTDLYFKDQIWRGKDLGKDKSQEYIPGRTPPRFVNFGKITGLSPVRSQYFTQQFVTRSNVIGTMLGQGLDFAAAGIDDELQQELNRSTGEYLTTMPFSRRFFKSTSPYVNKDKADEVVQEVNRERQKNVNKLKTMINKKKNQDEIVDFIMSVEDPFESDRLFDRYIKTITKQKISFQVRQLPYITPKARARVFYELYKEADDKGKQVLWKEAALVGGIITKGEFMFELSNLMAQDPEEEIPELEQEK
jgi:hypothetical protein